MKRSISDLTAGIYLCLLIIPFLTSANDSVELRNVREQIKENQRELSHYQKQTEKLRKRVQQEDRHIAQLARELWHLNQKRKVLQRDVQNFTQDLQTLTLQFKQQKQVLAQQLRQLAIAGHKPLLTSIQQSAEHLKLVTYYTYLNQARMASLDKLTVLQASIQKQKKALHDTQKQLEKTTQQKQNQRKALLSAQKDRARTLEKNKKLITKYQHYLNDLQQAQTHLQNTPTQNMQLAGLQPLAGKLSWPIKGQVLAQFNQKKTSDMRWKGLLIAAEEGTAVNAVADGVVLFADWLENYGMVTILDHGQDYFTLYGHNQTLLVTEGDTVKQREPIALLGQSGFQKQPALYFEMRHRGDVLDPKMWLIHSQ